MYKILKIDRFLFSSHIFLLFTNDKIPPRFARHFFCHENPGAREVYLYVKLHDMFPASPEDESQKNWAHRVQVPVMVIWFLFLHLALRDPISSPKLRLGSWNLKTMRFGGD